MNPWQIILDNRVLLLNGLGLTLALSVASIASSTVIGFVVGLVRSARVPGVTQVLRVYTEVFRGSPLLIQMLFLYFGAAYLGLPGVSAFLAAFIAITLYIGAYISEIFRAGFGSVSPDQREAARTLGMSRLDTVWFVVFPQAMRVSIGPLVGQWIILIKSTAYASIIGLADLLHQSQGLIQRYGNPFEVLAVVAVVFFVICYPLSLLATRLERKVSAW